MKNKCVAQLGALLLLLQLLSIQVVRAQNVTEAPMNTTMNTTMMYNYTMAPTVMGNMTDKNGCGRTEAHTLLLLLLPLALAASLLHDWSS